MKSLLIKAMLSERQRRNPLSFSSYHLLRGILRRVSEPRCGKEEFGASSNSCEREVPAHSHTELPLAAELPAPQPWRSKPDRAFAICIALPCFFFFQAIAVWDSALCLQAQIWQKVILLQHCIIPRES